MIRTWIKPKSRNMQERSERLRDAKIVKWAELVKWLPREVVNMEILGCGCIFQKRNMERGSSWEADGEFSFKILKVEFEECIKYLGGDIQ